MERRVVGSIALNVVRAGPPDGLLLTLLHGFPESWFEWRSLYPTVSGRGLLASSYRISVART
jgi:pimeloyl-ACP methyl ester carboxylesterase